jgi:adenylate kinase
VLKQRLAKTDKKGYILDGYPRTFDQAKALDNITKIDAVVLLQVPEWIIVERLSTRRICRNCGTVYNIRYLKPKVDMICDKCGGELYQRSDDTPKVIKERIEVYEKQTQPILKYYQEKKIPLIEFKTESIDMPPEVAVEEIMKGIKKLGPT